MVWGKIDNPEEEPKYTDDDGLFDNGNRAQKHYDETFSPSARARQKAAEALKNADNNAADLSNIHASPTNAISGQKNREEAKAVPTFKNNVAGISKPADKVKGKSSIFKKGGPILAILGILVGVGGGMLGAQGLMCISFVENISDKFNSIGVSQEMRTSSFISKQLETNKRNCVKSSIFGTKFKVSAKQEAKLKKLGIDVEDINGKTFLKYDGKYIAASKKAAEAIDGAIDFDTAFHQNSEFRHAYIEGSATWRTAVGAWFDKITNKFLTAKNIIRNHSWNENKPDSDAGTNADASADRVRGTIEDDVGNGDIDGKSRISKSENDVDENGNPTPDGKKNYAGSDTGGLSISKSDSLDSMKKKLEDFGNTKAAKATGVASAVASGVCSVMDAIGAIGLIVAAAETMQVVQLASSYLEGVQKSQIDDSKNAPINDLGNTLTATSTETFQVTKKGGTSDAPVAMEETVEITGSAMTSESVSALFGGYVADSTDPSIESFNIWGNIQKGLLGLGVSTTSYATCIATKAAASAVGIGEDLIQLAVCLIPPFVGCASYLAEAAIGALANFALSQAISFIVGMILPVIAKMVTRDIVNNLAGESLGNAIMSGASSYISSNAKLGGQAAASKESYIAYLGAYDSYIADKARYERETRSPFDTSSQYTFMGKILISFSSLVSSKNSILGLIGSTGRVLSSSIAPLIPGVSAAENVTEASEIAERTASNCTYADSVNALADEFCNPLIITDLTTMGSHPGEVIDEIDAMGGNFEDVPEGEETPDMPTIKEKSKLADYIVYCGQRESMLGVADQNIASAIQGGGGLGSDILAVVPIAGDLAEIFNDKKAAENIGYITGEACVTGNESEVLSWEEEGKYFERFIEDQRLAENMGLVEKSSVTAFLEDYYEKHPLDDSLEGVLARKTGLTKENVIAAVDTINYLTFIANYEPDGYYPLNYQTPEEDEVHIKNKGYVDYENYISQSEIINIDTKRTYSVTA